MLTGAVKWLKKNIFGLVTVYEDMSDEGFIRKTLERIERLARNDSEEIIFSCTNITTQKVISELFKKATDNKESVLISGYHGFAGLHSNFIEFLTEKAIVSGCSVVVIARDDEDFAVPFVVVGGKRCYWTINKGRCDAHTSFNKPTVARIIIMAYKDFVGTNFIE